MAPPKAYSYIRMSTDLQLRGDSKRRQEELSRAFAGAHGLELDDQLELSDIGISAFKGDNVTSGALGRFLHAVEQGLVEPGSYLLVESLDRLSRQPVEDALRLFLNIIERGIVIATILDGQIYQKGQMVTNNLITSLVIMQRSYEESHMKSIRIATAWNQKRKNVETQKLTSMCPGWLSLDKVENRFDVDEYKSSVVRRIFEYSANGLGAYSIARTLNSTKTPPFGKGVGWHISSVKKLLKNRAVIGEHQPCRLVNGKRQEIGEPIDGYYPPIIENDLFHRAAIGINTRALRSGGRSGEHMSNLFAGMIYCGYCKSKVRMLNKGNGPKGGRYLLCSDAHRRLNCTSTSWKYSDFETLLLTYVRELDLQTLLSSPDAENERKRTQEKIQSLEGAKLELKNRITRAYDSLANISLDIGIVGERMKDDQLKINALDDEIAALLANLDKIESHLMDEITIGSLVKSITLGSNNSDDTQSIFMTRKSIHHHLNRIVERISIYPDGYALKPNNSLNFLKNQDLSADEFEALHELITMGTQTVGATEKFLDILFKNGEVEYVSKRSRGDGATDSEWVKSLIQSRQSRFHERDDYVDSFTFPRTSK